MVQELFDSIEAAGILAAVEALTQGAETISERAKELAPVRRVFTGQAEAVETRLKSISEIEGDREIRKRLNLGPESTWINPPSTVTRAAPRLMHLRPVAPGWSFGSPENRLRREAAMQRLDRRGRWELKSGRAIHKEMLGGRLRDEIHAVPAVVDGAMISARVVSPTPYAKYQEFGTRHNPAHPYLRPAAHESEAEILMDVRRSVAKRAQAAVPHVRVNVKVALKVR